MNALARPLPEQSLQARRRQTGFRVLESHLIGTAFCKAAWTALHVQPSWDLFSITAAMIVAVIIINQCLHFMLGGCALQNAKVTIGAGFRGWANPR